MYDAIEKSSAVPILSSDSNTTCRVLEVCLIALSSPVHFLQALSKTLTVDELFYLKEQFALLEPNKNGTISFDNVKTVCIF